MLQQRMSFGVSPLPLRRSFRRSGLMSSLRSFEYFEDAD
jgi:hypothetical protein